MKIECVNEAHGKGWVSYLGDAVSIERQLPSNSIDFRVYSPPFANLYTYSDSALDMGNCADDAEFFRHYSYLIREEYRTTKPTRLVAVHCKDLVDYAGADGRAGLRDFPGDITRAFENCNNDCEGCGVLGQPGPFCALCGGKVNQRVGFKRHSRVTIWKCPVTEMQRTKAHGLLYRTLRTDASFTRQGLAEYLLVFRKWPETEEQKETAVKITHNPADFPLDQWQEWASPVWTTIDQTNVLNVEQARDDKDEKHMCPLQLDLIERAIVLWSNEGDVVRSPFAGIASEGVVALRKRRRFIGSELKESYWRSGIANLAAAEPDAKGSQLDMFALLSQPAAPVAAPPKVKRPRAKRTAAEAPAE